MKTERIRDCLVLEIHPGELLVITCDSIGAIGNKEKDVVKVTPEHTGHETAKVALGEMIALGAAPVAISDGLSVEMEPTGRRIMAGIQEAIDELPEYDIAMTGSCEDNMPTLQTGAGITVVGMVSRKDLFYQITRPGNVALLMGRPLFGKDFSAHLDAALRLPDYRMIRKIPYVKEMVPVGSHGALFEAEKIAADNGLVFKEYDNLPFDIRQSGGPASCCVITVSRDAVGLVQEAFYKEATPIGEFTEK